MIITALTRIGTDMRGKFNKIATKLSCEPPTINRHNHPNMGESSAGAMYSRVNQPDA